MINTEIRSQAENAFPIHRRRSNFAPKTQPLLLEYILLRENNALPAHRFHAYEQTSLLNKYIPNTCTRIFHDYEDHVFCGAFSDSGNAFITASQDPSIHIYDPNQNYKIIHNIEVHDVGWSVLDLDYHEGSNSLIYAGWSPKAFLCNLHSEEKLLIGLDFRPTVRGFSLFSVRFSLSGTEALAGSNDACFYIFDLERNERITRIKAHDEDINSTAFADNTSQVIYTASDDCTIKVWDRRILQNNTPVGIFVGHVEGVAYIHPKGDGRYVLSNSKDQTIKLWDLRRMTQHNEGHGAHRRLPRSRQHYYWDYREGIFRGERGGQNRLDCDSSIMTYGGHLVLQTLIRARISPLYATGQKYIYGGSADGKIFVWDLLTGKTVCVLKNHTSIVRDVSWHPYEPIILSSSWDRSVRMWTFVEP